MSGQNVVRIDNVHIYDGQSFSGIQALSIKDGRIIKSSETADETIDGQGGYLIPGLIDSHVHLSDVAQLSAFCQHGQTTVLDMACWPPSRMNSYRNLQGLPQIMSAGIAASSPGSTHSRMPHWPADGLLTSADQADEFVRARIAEGSDYIKVVCDNPGPSPELVKALRESARAHGKMAIAHAARLEPFRLAIDCDFDIITHAPVDAPLTVDDVRRMKEKGIFCAPTLVMERAIASMPPRGPAVSPQPLDFEHARQSVKLLHQGGVPILASTDANSAPFPLMPRHGTSLHEEFEMLVEIGMTNLEVLQSALALPAERFGLLDRGRLEPGTRADLVLLAENPREDIKNTRSVQKVWCAGELAYEIKA